MLKRNLGIQLLVVGATRAGKTEFVVFFAAEKPSGILRRFIGDGQSSLKPKKINYTTDPYYEDKIEVVVTKPQSYLSHEEFQKKIVDIFKTIIKELNVNDNLEEAIKYSLENLFSNLKNIEGSIKLISDQCKDQILTRLNDILKSITVTDFKDMYLAAKNSTPSDNTNKKQVTEELLATAIREYLDGQKAITEGLDEVEKAIQEDLDEKFNAYFLYDINNDIYKKTINLDNSITEDEEFINCFFNNNNNTFSLELLCEHITVIAALDDLFEEKLINLRDDNGIVNITFIDTQGIFHNSDVNPEDYIRKLLFDINLLYDGIIYLSPLAESDKDKELDRILFPILKTTRREADLYVLHNKVDLLINKHSKISPKDRRRNKSLSEVQDNIIIENIKEKVEEKNQFIVSAGLDSSKRKHYVRYKQTYVFSLKDDNNISNELSEMYDCFEVLGKFLKDCASSVNFEREEFILDEGERAIEIALDLVKLKSILDKDVFARSNQLASILANIEANIGITPHGNGYNALISNMKNGSGHNSDINMNYFVNVRPFNISYPDTISNLIIDTELIKKVFLNTIVFTNGMFKDSKALDLIWDRLNHKNIYQRRLSSYLIYYYLLNKGYLSGGWSFRDKFDILLKNSRTYLCTDNKYENYYESTEAILKEIMKQIDDRFIKYIYND
jgi:hypothetical protein